MSDNRASLELSQPGRLSSPAIAPGPSPFGRPDGHRVGRRRGDRIILASSLTEKTVAQAGVAARSDAPLLLVGPSGSGRRHLARAIHEWSPRAGRPLISLPVYDSAESLQARDLFGTSGGSDPLSSGGNVGALAEADAGSLLIERIDLLSETLRQRLARALREGSYRREGSTEVLPLRARLIATADAPNEAVLAGTQMQILRLAGLRERSEDILPLAAHFLAVCAEEEAVEPVGFTVEARRLLLEEAWPGNACELRERIRQAVRLTGSGSISADALMLASNGEEIPSFKEAKRAFETRYVETLLRRCSGNISRAARLAKKDRKDFYDVIRRTGIDPTQFRS
jgi:two-component system, NtrC family, response regulator GlrR